MIRFFRHLRQRLLAENRFSRYLAYAIGEIALVMIGILLALQVNTWNENRKEQKEARRLLTDLQEEVTLALEDRENYIQQNEYVASLMGSVLTKLFSDAPENLTEEECASILWSHTIRWAPYNPSTLEELVSTGKISILADLPLRKALLDFRNLAGSNREWLNKVIFEANVLVDKYPALIIRNWNPERQRSDLDCRVEAMRENKFFLAQLQSNKGRWGSPLQAAKKELQALERIRDYLKAAE
ncbi:MAG TPA: DUF6090 family protein [Robiginitalea sp.]|nr:DUF6090 family protein [Robiginitalea sp.]